MLLYALIITNLVLLLIIAYLSVKNRHQRVEIKNLNYVCDSTRTFRHDFNNIMQAIGGYIKTNNVSGLNNYYNTLIPECLKINNLYRFHSQLISNGAIYSLISSKYNLAENQNIKMSLNILLDLNMLKIDSYHLTRILGILLDNAIEASCEAPNKIINLSFQPLNSKQLIIIENTYLSKGISTQKFFQKNFSTKQKNSGLGLWEVQNIINKKKNLELKTQAGSEFFKQTLMIS